MLGDVAITDDSFIALRTVEWTIGDAAYLERGVLVWPVTGSNGENRILAEGPTRDAT
jgi:hypothetical protein